MAETGKPPDEVTAENTGRHSRRRRARKRRAGDSAGGVLSDGSLEARLTTWISAVIGIGLLVGQIIATRIVLPGELMRASLLLLGLIVTTSLIVWLDLLRSKKRNPRPRWLRGVLIAGFLFFSIALGSLVVLSMSANPIAEADFSGSDSAPGGYTARSQFDIKMLQLKFAIFSILTSVAGLALLAHVFGTASHRRSGRAAASVGH
jgi:hypothetical protein